MAVERIKPKDVHSLEDIDPEEHQAHRFQSYLCAVILAIEGGQAYKKVPKEEEYCSPDAVQLQPVEHSKQTRCFECLTVVPRMFEK